MIRCYRDLKQLESFKERYYYLKLHGIVGEETFGFDRVHHMNPITLEDIEEERDSIFDPEYLICCSPRTHKAIHFGDENLLPKDFVERRPNDTCLWR